MRIMLPLGQVTPVEPIVRIMGASLLIAAARIRVFVARSRHKNGVERNRGATRYGILREHAPLGKNNSTVSGWHRLLNPRIVYTDLNSLALGHMRVAGNVM
jgi:hypothetical protein